MENELIIAYLRFFLVEMDQTFLDYIWVDGRTCIFHFAGFSQVYKAI